MTRQPHQATYGNESRLRRSRLSLFLVPWRLVLPALVIGSGLLLVVFAYYGNSPATAEFMLPKEVAGEVAASFAALALLAAGPVRLRLDWLGATLAAFLVLSVLSLMLEAINKDLALRSLYSSIVGLEVFWVCCVVSGDRRASAVLPWFVAVTAVALAALVVGEAYGLYTLTPPSVAPAGTMGNRNRAGHLLVLMLPSLWWLLNTYRERRAAVLVLGATALSGAAILTTRSRGAWFAGGLCIVGLIVMMIASSYRSPLWNLSVRRTSQFLVALVIGVVAGLVTPMTLRWTERSPREAYLNSALRLVDVGSGSGLGRVTQYRQTAPMIRDHLALGVGPGNWSVQYLRYVQDDDPSVDLLSPIPTPRLPQSDWIGIAAERGVFALFLLLGAALLTVRGARHAAPASVSWPDNTRTICMLLTMLVLLVLGGIDAVLLTPDGAYVAPLLVGMMAGDERVSATAGTGGAIMNASRIGLATIATLIGIASVSYSVQHLRADALLRHAAAAPADATPLLDAVRLTPGRYDVRFALARMWVSQNRCELARSEIEAANHLRPGVPALTLLAQRCGTHLAP